MAPQLTLANRYDLVRQVGRGGAGVVWLAEDTVLDRHVAVKRIGLLPGATEEDVERVRREARVSAMLSDEHIVLVYDLVQERSGESWLVMEYVESRNLAQIVRAEGPLAPDVAADYLAQAVSALAAAHRAGIVHRDVKPSNLLVRADGVLKLSDFGIARADQDQTLTITGTLIGSPGYLSPEVASGSPATAASDMWALGATAFHALEGHPPYPTEGPLVGTLFKIVNEEPPQPTRAGWLEPLVRGLMQRDPARRWSADQVAAFLASRVAPDAGPPPSEPRGERTASLEPVGERRSRLPIVLVAAAIVLLLAIAGTVALLSRDSGGSSGSASGGSTSSGTTSPSASPTPSAAAMTQFVQTYLAGVTTDPSQTFAMLTPAFQSTSGGLAGYRGFWRTVRSATPSNIRADPATMTVSYDVVYKKRHGKDSTDSVTLFLTPSGSTFQIAGDNDHPPR